MVQTFSEVGHEWKKNYIISEVFEDGREREKMSMLTMTHLSVVLGVKRTSNVGRN